MAMKSRFSIEAIVEAGRADRQDAVVSVALDCQQALWHAGNDGRFHPLSLEVCQAEGSETGAPVPAQVDGVVVSWIARGRMAAGERRRYRIGFDSEDAPAMASLGKPVFRDRVIITDLGKELLVSQNSTELARYRYREVWKPFFHPVFGAHGNVVRDIRREHPHQHGLYLSYGGEDCLGVNIWSEEESLRPPLGPSGKMAHEGFERIEYGWVCGQFTQRLSYLKPDGYPFARELRTVRFFAPSAETRIVDWTVRLEDPQDTGGRRVALACRVADTMRVRDLDQKSTDGMMGALRENGGRLENSAGGVGELESRGGKFAWLDFSGPVEEGTDGIALFDHPENPGAGGFGCREYGLFTVGHGYPTEGFARGGAAVFRYRAFIHAGDATRGGVALAYEDYVHPCRVTPGGEILRND
jgi:Family of unknown function (DUF6807)